MSKGSASKTLVWILMAMLIFGLGGFGITNLSGGAVRSVGTVGDKEIDINEYARALQQEMNALDAQTGRAVSFGEAQAAGIDRGVLNRLIATRAMDAETTRMGISIGDENLREELLQIREFQNADGSFDRAAYSYALEQTRMSEAQFEASIREDAARTLLQAAIVSGVIMNETYGDVLLNFVGEQRTIEIARLDEDVLTFPVTEATEADLKAFYDANIDQFTVPAQRQITYAWLSPAMLIDSVDVDEAALKDLYTERDAEFNRPERRLVERLAFADMASAEAAKTRLDNEEVSFETLVLDRGLNMVDVDMGDVSAAELGDAGPAVFAAVVGSLTGPVQSDLGPALFRINGVLPAASTSFEDALPQLREELAAERARRVIDAQVGDVDDLLAAGATLEELADETEMELGQVGWHAGVSDGISGYETFRALAAVVTKEDFPQIDTLADGGMFALRLDDETPAAPAPFAEVKDDVATAWRRAEVVARLQEMADGLVPLLEGEVEFAAFGLEATVQPNLLRSGFVADTPEGFVQSVFEMELGAVSSAATENGLLIVRLIEIVKPDPNAPEVSNLLASVLDQGAAGLSQDIFEAYAQNIQFEQGVTLNQPALNAVHAQFQ
ncbi:peptidyl-prolyl cis-trans isomerase D [Shimia gijangensis]|uniref:Peptidyl-prolyl cis-trans isomerase D n=1 Tax=Shimia gijangensis TaxID=1470563 RepID=A0A1M6ETZ3_9RHOB|nr:SurA N-terminal domain-containing protein [Shimia gijangensis]SHI88846.1 peptidyl-prolyl cis-trans isomerase D [Shimia gijangensis]